jgi:signal peptidase I
MESAPTISIKPAAASRWRVFAFGRNPRLTLIRAAITASVLVVVFLFILLPVRVIGVSMAPTYKNSGVNFVNRAAYWFREPARGDVVGYAFTGRHAMLFKRIIALPGETIQIRDGTVFIDGQPLDEPYVKYRARWNTPPKRLQPGEYFLIGDNRGMNQSDHEFGQGVRSNIVGKALW